MEVKTTESESILILNLQGDLDSPSALELQKYIDLKLESGFQRFLLDLSQLATVSSGGIAFLLRLGEKSGPEKSYLSVLVSPGLEVSKLIRFFGIQKKVPIFSTQSDAKKYLNQWTGSPNHGLSGNPKVKKSETDFATVIPSKSRPSERSERDLPSTKSTGSSYPNQIQFYYKGRVPRYQTTKPKEEITRFAGKEHLENRDARGRQISEKNWGEDSEPVSILEPVTSPISGPGSLPGTGRDTGNLSGSLPPKVPAKTDTGERSKDLIQTLEDKMSELRTEFQKSEKNLEQRILEKIQSRPPVPRSSDRPVEIIDCEFCGTGLKVQKLGKYRCPKCSGEFIYTGRGSITILEKLT
jgi:anti-anti-sigma factor